jgi:hypothetical protein
MAIRSLYEHRIMPERDQSDEHRGTVPDGIPEHLDSISLVSARGLDPMENPYLNSVVELLIPDLLFPNFEDAFFEATCPQRSVATESAPKAGTRTVREASTGRR